jgi:hypothetical protein
MRSLYILTSVKVPGSLLCHLRNLDKVIWEGLMALEVSMADNSHVIQVRHNCINEWGERAPLSGAGIDHKVILGGGAVGFHLGPDFITTVHCAEECSKPLRPVKLGKDCVDDGKAHYIKGLFLIKKGYRSILLKGIDQVNDHLDIDDIFPAISSRDEAPLVVANFFG